VGVIYLAGSIDCNFDSLQAYGNTAQGQPTRIRVSQGVVMGNVINKVDPVYPDMARQARLSGSVVYQVMIGQDGSVNNVRVVSGHPMLVQSGLDAVKQWTFKPYYLNGQPVAVETQITMTFRPDGSVN
jgi:periplasmic protein TonB